MSTRFYIRYTPVRRGLTGMEMLPQYLDEYFPGVTYTGVIKDGLVEYGYIEGSGDLLSQVLQTCDDKFSIKRLYEDTFIGACYPLYNPTTGIDEETPPTFSEMMDRHGIVVPSDVLPLVKKAKVEEFKEIVKKEFEDWNDSVASVSRAAMLYTIYSDSELTSEQQTQRDDLKSRIKAVYTPDICLKGMESLVTLLENVLVPYYTARDSVESATSVNDVLDITYK